MQKGPYTLKEKKIVGFCFRPLSHKAANHWTANFLARERDKGKKLFPSIMEPEFKVFLPRNTILELLMSIKPGAHFAVELLLVCSSFRQWVPIVINFVIDYVSHHWFLIFMECFFSLERTIQVAICSPGNHLMDSKTLKNLAFDGGGSITTVDGM